MDGYKGTVTMAGGMRPLEGQDYALVSTDLVQAAPDGTNLKEYLDGMEATITEINTSLDGFQEKMGVATDEDIDKFFQYE